jgi:hypothetical protein
MFLTDILENSVQIFCRLDVQSHTQADVSGYKKHTFAAPSVVSFS